MILTEEMTVNTYQCFVTKYIDGDTLDMNINLGFDTFIIRRVRLIDIDAPEINNTKAESVENKAGQVAFNWVKLWFTDKTPPFYLQAEHKGLYGRWLGQIWAEVGEESLNDYMITNGYYNSGWTWAVQKTLIEAWYDSPEWERFGKGNLLGNQSELLKRTQ